MADNNEQFFFEAARAAEQHCPGCVIKFGINAGRAWFNVL